METSAGQDGVGEDRSRHPHDGTERPEMRGIFPQNDIKWKWTQIGYMPSQAGICIGFRVQE